MQSMAEVVAGLKAKMPLISAAVPVEKAPYKTPDKALHLFTFTELQDAIAHCAVCGGLGYLRPSDDLPFNHPDFGKLLRCDACWRYHAEQAKRKAVEDMKPTLAKYSMLKGELLAKTFDNFRRERAAAALDAVRNWAAAVWRGATGLPWLYLWGAPGNGKTHLAAAAANGLIAAHIPVMFSTFTELVDLAARDDFAEKEAVIQVLQAIPALIIDDITEQELRTDWKQSLLFRVLDSRYVGNMPTLLVSNLSPAPVPSHPGIASLRDYEARIASRIMDKNLCTVIVNTASDYRTLKA